MREYADTCACIHIQSESKWAKNQSKTGQKYEEKNQKLKLGGFNYICGNMRMYTIF